MSHVVGRGAILLLPLLYGTVLHFPEHRDALTEAMVEVAPTLSIALPDIWQSRASEIQARIEESSRFRRRLCGFSLEKRRQSEPPRSATGATKVLAALGWWTVLRPIRGKMGLRRVRSAWIGGAHVAPDLIGLWRALGVPLAEFYCLTESSGLVAFEDPLAESGRAGLELLPAIELSVAESGELRVKGPGTAGRHPPSSDGAREERWIATGDIVELTSARALTVACRLTDLVEMDGQPVRLVEIERLLHANRVIRRAAVVGGGRAYLSALIDLDFRAMAAWARANSVRYGSVGSLATAPQVVELVADLVNRGNASLATRGLPPVKQFRILSASSGFEQNELIGTTGELRRAEINSRFADLIESMYQSTASEAHTTLRQEQGD